MKKKIVMVLLLLISVFIITGCKKEESLGRNLTEDEKKILMEKVNSLEFFDFYGRNFSTNDLTNQEVLHYAFYSSSDDADFKKLKDLVDKTVDFELKPENFKCFIHDNDDLSSYYFLYNEDTGEYDDNLEHESHGAGGFLSNVYNRYRSAYNEGDIYTISVYKIFSALKQSTTDERPLFYATYSDAKNNKNSILNLEEFYNWDSLKLSVDPQEYLDKMDKDKLVTYTYTFKKVGDNYLLTNYEFKKKA